MNGSRIFGMLVKWSWMDGITGFGWLSEILSSKLGSFQQEHHSENTVGAITHSLTLHQVTVSSNRAVLLRRMSIKEKWISTHGALSDLALVGVEGGGGGESAAAWSSLGWRILDSNSHPPLTLQSRPNSQGCQRKGGVGGK